MGKIADLLGRLARGDGRSDDGRPPVQPPEMIPSGPDYPELCMLPVDGTPAAEGQPYRFQRLVELKADGIRGLRIPNRIFTREGVPLNCALHCLPALQRLEAAYGEPMFFDGEYVADNGFNATLAEFRRGRGEGVLWLFDAVPMSAWLLGGRGSLPLIERKARLIELAPAADSPFVGVLDHWMLNGIETEAKFRELALEGYEGVVSKDPCSFYHRERSPDWLRIKAVQTVDGSIIDIIQRDGVLRKIMVRGPAGPKPISVTTGWSRAEGLEIIQRFTAGATPTAEIAYELSTGVERSVRGARFNRLRPDKGEKA
jgi:ATP-dependent DNA ligase